MLVVAAALSGLAIYRMHGIFGSQNANASRGGGSCPITLDRARTIVDQALAHAHGNDFPPMTIAVLDSAGQLVAFVRKTTHRPI